VEIVVADPAKNITVFVLGPWPNSALPKSALEGREQRAEISRVLLADPRFKAEQVGFVLPPTESRPLWRLEMMGGEFCGNAARSFGLYVARETGLKGQASVQIEISGAAGPLTVTADLADGRAEVEIPKPAAISALEFEGRCLPLVIFDGIVHAIVEGIPVGERVFHRIRGEIEKKFLTEDSPLPDAIGVMFLDAESRLDSNRAGIAKVPPLMRPAVYVRATDSLVFESSCGSGTAALAAWETRNAGDGENVLTVKQSGGVIEARVCRKNGELAAIYIGGPVSLSGRISV
jgi:diaminopimelate epimerase